MNIEELLELMVEKAASDIYITVDSTPAYRVEGKTTPMPGEALTMEAAITFAETGHLCLATLHANNANQSLECIINYFPAERDHETRRSGRTGGRNRKQDARKKSHWTQI